jgi:hypothetical protein
MATKTFNPETKPSNMDSIKSSNMDTKTIKHGQHQTIKHGHKNHQTCTQKPSNMNITFTKTIKHGLNLQAWTPSNHQTWT